MRTISPQSEEQIIGCLKQAVALVDEQGMTPDAALTKIARDNRWKAETIKFASYAYNTGRQTAQREGSDSILDKLAEFPLVDPDKVVAAVFPSEVKTAAEIERQDAISAEYNRGPDFLFARDQKAHLKAAAAGPWYAPVNHPTNAPDPMLKMAKRHSKFVEMKKVAEEAASQSRLAYEGMLKAAGELGDYFKQRREDRFAFDQFEKTCQVFYPGTTKILDYVHSRNRMKEARANDYTKLPHSIDHSQAPWSLVKAACDAANSVIKKRAQHADAVVAMDKYAHEEIRPHSLIPHDDPGDWTLLGHINQKEANLFSGAIGGAMATGANKAIAGSIGTPEDNEKLITKRVADLEDPDHDARLKEIQVQAMLADMMNDDVIGGFEPDQVAQGYNEISQMMPRSSTQPLAMRAYLRRYLQGNMEPFEINDMAKLEGSMAKTETPPEFGSNLITGSPMKEAQSHWLFNDAGII